MVRPAPSNKGRGMKEQIHVSQHSIFSSVRIARCLWRREERFLFCGEVSHLHSLGYHSIANNDTCVVISPSYISTWTSSLLTTIL